MDEENRFMVGLLNGILLSLPLWGIILSVVGFVMRSH
jgi:hypothetical protein